MPIVYRVPQATVIVIERMGRFHRVAETGLRFRLPILDAPKLLDEWPEAVRRYSGQPVLIELAEQQTDTSPRTIITRDNVEMQADASVFWQVVDPVRAVYEVDNLPRSITDLAVTTLRNMLGELTLNDALGSRTRINLGLLDELEATSRKWGVRVNRVELQELRAANPEASGAMLQQMSSERAREARVAQAEGERRARALRAEGTAKAIGILVEADMDAYQRAREVMGHGRAFEYLMGLKYLETIERIAESPSTKLFLPAGADLRGLLAAGIGSELADHAPPAAPNTTDQVPAAAATNPEGES